MWSEPNLGKHKDRWLASSGSDAGGPDRDMLRVAQPIL